MIRIYLDWNVISNLKKPEYKDILDYIHSHKSELQFLYSPAHFTDLLKSYKPDNEYFNDDLEMLDYLCEKHLIRWEKDQVEPLFAKPSEYFKEIDLEEDPVDFLNMEKVFQDLDGSLEELGFGKMGSLLKLLYQSQPSGIEITDENRDILKKMFPTIKDDSTMWDLMKDIGPFSKKLLKDGEYYKDFRKTMAKQGLKLESNAGNWEYCDVINNIDEFLKQFGTDMTFLKYVETTFKHRKEPATVYEFFTIAYLMLDMIGYKSDKLPKSSDNMQNIQADGEHSFYGAHCDFFVAIDKILRIKSKVLYNEFNISTQVIELKEFIKEIDKEIDPMLNKGDFIHEALSFCIKENLVESDLDNKVDGRKSYAFEIPFFYFNFFNYIIYTHYPKEKGIVISYKKVFRNYSRFVYYSEVETLIDLVANYFGFENVEELDLKKKEFIYKDDDTIFSWYFNLGIIRLEKDDDTKRPVLSYIISTDRLSNYNVV